MDTLTLDRPLPVPTLNCAQIATIYSGAARARHALGSSVAIAALAPAIADRVVAAPVDRFDLDAGTIDIPVAEDRWTRVALGPTLWRAASIVVGSRTSGYFAEDAHGGPLTLDPDACDHAVDVVRWSDPRCREFDWTVDELRRSAALHVAHEFGSPALLLAMAGLQGTDVCPGDVHDAQRTVSAWWEDRVAWTVSRRDRLERTLGGRSYGLTQLFDPYAYWGWLR